MLIGIGTSGSNEDGISCSDASACTTSLDCSLAAESSEISELDGSGDAHDKSMTCAVISITAELCDSGLA